MYLEEFGTGGGFSMTKIKDFRIIIMQMITIIIICLISGIAAADSYQLGIGDILQISVWGHPELTTTIEVRPDGYITFPLVGDHDASGKTTSQLALEIQSELADYVIEPSVTVMVVEFRKINVQVLGEVRNSGYYTLRAGSRLMDALGLAGGPTSDANLSCVTLTRIEFDSTSMFNLDVDKYIQAGDLENNPVLQDQDVIYITTVGNVLILGSVNVPGSYRIQDEMDILDLLALSGGVLDSGDLSQVTLTRKINGIHQEYQINLHEIMASGKGSWKIQPEDVLYIPEKQQVTLFGEVKLPGNYPLETGKKLVEIIGTAGGLTPLGDARQVSIVRNINGKQELLKVDISNAVLGKVGGDNPTLVGGDIIYIPEALNTVLVLGEVRNPGSFVLKEQMGILDLLALSGDTTEKAALDRVTLTRQTGDEIIVQEINIAALKQTGTGRQIQLLPGDVLFVPEGAPQAFVLGEVRNSGAYRVHSDTKLLDLLTAAGGVLDTAGEQILITRSNNTIEISSRGLLRFGFGDQIVQPGDVIYVTEGKHQFLVLGEVRNPGYYHIGFDDRVLDGIAKAGGLMKTAAASQVTLTRQLEEKNEIFEVDLQRLMSNKYLSDNYLLEGGDVIIVPKAGQVMVLGEVRNPGYYQFEEGQKVLDILGIAGGMTELAASDEIQLTRWNGSESITDVYNIDQVIKGLGGVNPLVEPGDVLVVPKQNRDVLVLGEVVRPGMYTIDDNNRVLDIIGKAGGLSQNADSIFTITRSEGEAYQTLIVDYLALVENDSHIDNYRLVGGDVVYVPEKNRRVLVFGEVQRPGAYLVDRYSTLLDILALAGGTTEQALLDEITITLSTDDHQEEQIRTIDLDAVIEKQQPNISLSGGEVIYVPKSQQVLVMGEVVRPGAFTLAKGTRILDILALAGGLRSNLSSQEIILTRQGSDKEQVWLIDYDSLMNAQSEHNHLLEGGDVLFIPELSRQVLVLGEVVKPGVYTIYEGARVLDAIALAGGPKSRAELGSVGIYRGGNIDLLSKLTIGQDRLLFQGDAHENPEIQSGDIIFVPETKKPDWNAIFGFMGGIKTFQQIIDWFIPDE